MDSWFGGMPGGVHLGWDLGKWWNSVCTQKRRFGVCFLWIERGAPLLGYVFLTCQRFKYQRTVLCMLPSYGTMIFSNTFTYKGLRCSHVDVLEIIRRSQTTFITSCCSLLPAPSTRHHCRWSIMLIKANIYKGGVNVNVQNKVFRKTSGR